MNSRTQDLVCLVEAWGSNGLYSKSLSIIETLNFEGQAAVGSYLMITNSNIRLLGS